MEKVIIDKYIIRTDCSDDNVLNDLVKILRKYNIKAYNYKVEFLHNKVSIRAIRRNIILNLSNLYIKDMEDILEESEELYTTRFGIEFHNIPSKREILDKLEATKLPYSKVDVFKDYVRIWTINGFTFIDGKSLEATYYLSLILEKVNLEPFNLGRIRKVKDMRALLLLKYYGIRDLDLIEKLIDLGLRIENDNEIIIDNISISKKGIFKKGNEVSKKELYELVKVNK
ncbi:hypothetical protein SULI_03965 [Saccharolobus solfataricus]|uniref:DUF2067 domain-containing protein n=3 Tax=Saccharolobus solfataricus TaxID=2287 RepID=Q97UL4_SACS2|nr:hypothetical protein [Saccharolobus solfataricus]AAK43095.1 Hypothetical protein SSO2990 [Saccharolobus solfataricus P2]AKA73148.1 hypothetical protein SULB_0777 [Saccharolobus solfataricus]AKA75846.1 hypothetical protein SULC_0775 [Saccharolobus solfataricus]AKA78538.1 hypothetical protein SULA_0775 [Saccharolobus solfataricus]AZF67650.1 hypothetical protein SULG_03965 [Saccharolobus solfataricus]